MVSGGCITQNNKVYCIVSIRIHCITIIDLPDCAMPDQDRHHTGQKSFIHQQKLVLHQTVARLREKTWT